MKLIQIRILVIISVLSSISVVQSSGDLSVSGTTATGALTVSGLDCTVNANGGKLTTDASGAVSCSDDDNGGGNTLDAAYDQGGEGAGRTIIADSGAIFIQGTGGLDLDIGSLLQTPGDPVLIGSLGIGTTPRSLFVSGHHAYVVDDGSNDLKVIDVSDPSAPSLVGSLGIGDRPFSVYVSGRYAYVAHGTTDATLKVIDVSDPGSPSVAGSLDVGDYAQSVHVSGRYAYLVGIGADELEVIDVSGAEVTSLIAHSMEAGNLQVRNDIVAQGQVQVSGGVSVGVGGIFSDGDIGVSGDAMIIGDATVDGDFTVTGSCSGCTSDINLKQNIQLLGNALHRISRLRGVSYDWREDIQEAQTYPGVQIGVLGQDVEAMFPELVGTDSRGYKFVRYQKLVAPLIEAVKELKGENDMLRANNEAIERRLVALERRLN